MIKILVVEDEEPISNLIKINLMKAGYSVVQAFDGTTAADIVEDQHFDLILLDVMLPGINGYELMDYFKSMEIPVIFLTAMSDIDNRVKGLKLGAEDYISKPFEMIELLARVETVLRRFNKASDKLEVLDVEIDLTSRRVTKSGVPINLTLKEFDLLTLFVRNKNIALYRETIYENVWGCMYMGDSRTVDLHVQRLRKKLNWEEYITAVYKVGYRLQV